MDHTNPGMLNMDHEKKLLDFPSRSADGQEGKPACVKTIEQKLWSTCDKHKKAIIGIVVSYLIFGCFFFFLGTLLPLSCQQDATDCPPDWITHQGHCYKFSREEKNWKESQNSCILHKASLAKITKEEMAIVRVFTRDHIFWIGLRREPDQPWKWLDGENSMLEIMGNAGDCAFLNNDATASSGRCNTEHRYICKKN
ncbi:C-type lectin domain family 2 member B-like [Ahaetulla prasina]|uniref:C-type lectin domain family 2 member B-like n=1 Tax=Ahaetulla prasina TaxID=499056 RepID=UPI0026472FA5|nr:C-type lectin domain family 2 member B-like [Ahaetulla prasina]XP_058026088.1 C-type lectin domain family 2 member B-like [Ahaetulla prasina]